MLVSSLQSALYIYLSVALLSTIYNAHFYKQSKVIGYLYDICMYMYKDTCMNTYITREREREKDLKRIQHL